MADAVLALVVCAIATAVFVSVARDVVKTSGVSFAEVVTTVFDGEQYVEISKTGYRFDGHYDHLKEQNLAWPPGWPLALKAVSLGGLVHPGLAGFVLNILLLLLNTFLLSREVRARTGSFVLCLLVAGTYAIHPYGEFQLAPFSEPLFVTQTLLFLALVRARRFWLAAIVAGLASGTRSAGLAFAPTLALVFLLVDGEGPRLARLAKAVGLGLVSVTGQLAYLGFSWLRFGDFLAPHRIQQVSHGELAPWEVPLAMLSKMGSPLLYLGSWTKDVRLPGTALVDLLMIVAVVGLVRAWRRRKDENDLWALAASMSVLWMLPLILLMNVGFVSPSNGRYSITLWIVLVPFAPLLQRWIPQRAQRLALPALALACLTASLVWFMGMTSNTLHGLAPF